MLQCPIHAVIPATCLTQEGLNPILVKNGWYRCTISNVLVKPVILEDDAAHPPVETPVATE